MSTEVIDPKLCPLCSGGNACVLANGDDDADMQQCWCFHEHIPAGALERVPSSARDQACICACCLQQLRRSPDAVILSASSLRLARLNALLKPRG